MLFWGSGTSVCTIYYHQKHHYNYQMGIIIMILLTHWFTGSNILLYWFHYLTHIGYIITDLLTWLANWLDWLKVLIIFLILLVFDVGHFSYMTDLLSIIILLKLLIYCYIWQSCFTDITYILPSYWNYW